MNSQSWRVVFALRFPFVSDSAGVGDEALSEGEALRLEQRKNICRDEFKQDPCQLRFWF